MSIIGSDDREIIRYFNIFPYSTVTGIPISSHTKLITQITNKIISYFDKKNLLTLKIQRVR
jgi:hypothetical protein